MYRYFKSTIRLEKHLDWNIHYFRNALTRFRLGYTVITTHRNRYRHDLPR